MHTRATRLLLIAIALGSGATAFAGQELLDVDSHFRSRIAKEKIKAAAQERKSEELQRSMDKKSLDQSNCGSQSIGNIDTGGQVGAAPREVFVFAPNAINVVGRGSCQ
jgi:hypothetical protein